MFRVREVRFFTIVTKISQLSKCEIFIETSLDVQTILHVQRNNITHYCVIISASEKSLQWDPQGDIGAPLAVGNKHTRRRKVRLTALYNDSH